MERAQSTYAAYAPHINSKKYIANKTKFKKSLYSTYKFGPYLLPYRKLLFLKNNIRKIISKKDAKAGGLYIYRGINAEKFSKMISRIQSLPTPDHGREINKSLIGETRSELLHEQNANIFSMYAFPISRFAVRTATANAHATQLQEKGKNTFTGNRKIDYFNLFEIKNNYIYKIQRVLKKKVNTLLNRNKE